jgi:hypothetical protein
LKYSDKLSELIHFKKGCPFMELLAVGIIGGTAILATVGEKVLTKSGKHLESDLIHNITNALLGGAVLGSFLFVTLKLVKMFILGV